MIIEMARLRILGPRDRLGDVFDALQDLGVMHLAEPGAPAPGVSPVELTAAQRREQRQLRRALDHVDRALAGLGLRAGPASRAAPRATRNDFARWARLGWRMRRAVDRLATREAALQEERALILKYQQFFGAFRALLESQSRWPSATAYHVLLRGGETEALIRLRGSLRELIGDAFELYSQPLPSGEIALLIVVAAPAAPQVERILAQARVQEIPVPASYGGGALTEAIPRMLARLSDLPAELEALRRERARLGQDHGAELRRARASLADRLGELEALPLSAVTARAFVIEGWAPARTRPTIEQRLAAGFGDAVVVTEVGKEDWASEDAPVVLSNPRLFRPFELLIRLLPLPRYGTIDPTPFVAVFFPAFFGLMVGDIGYGLLLGVLALVLRRRSQPGSTLRSAAEIAGACAVFTVLAGALFGELFGDLGRRWLGLRPIAFNREEALIPFLILAVSLGAVHVVLGLALGVAANIRHHPRHALGRGMSLVMIIAIILALLAAVHVLPDALLTPAVIALLAAFPVLIVAEGVVAPIELLSTVGNVLSYARIMALGVASVMLAVVANRMVGAIGSVAVGVVFALLFHLVNFAIALFSPTIHALRLHYVEFFGKFYSPGGVRYQPFGHWTREATR
ncbi:MAG TPA: V-type ATPase 116kDa subunit family protein [Gemmatimonadales bacterium]|nr:V-type ATPase 116kDa subunit family protein [Gemmatimonadales bacterium]